ncbi:MAG: hypothetical protein ACR2MO_00525 [Acidimicrobiales bacterium]
MTDVLQVEVDGDIDDERSSGLDGGAPRWGLPAAIAVVGLLLLGVLVVVVLPAVTGGSTAPPGATAVTRGRATPGSTVPVVKEDPRIAAAREALNAWGEFALTGRLDVLAGRLAPDGPQYRLLADEASQLSNQPKVGPAYAITMEDPTVTASGSTEAVIAATVIWSRPGEAGQSYRWELVLRPDDRGRWLLSTVRDRSTA